MKNWTKRFFKKIKKYKVYTFYILIDIFIIKFKFYIEIQDL